MQPYALLLQKIVKLRHGTPNLADRNSDILAFQTSDPITFEFLNNRKCFEIEDRM